MRLGGLIDGAPFVPFACTFGWLLPIKTFIFRGMISELVNPFDMFISLQYYCIKYKTAQDGTG